MNDGKGRGAPLSSLTIEEGRILSQSKVEPHNNSCHYEYAILCDICEE